LTTEYDPFFEQVKTFVFQHFGLHEGRALWFSGQQIFDIPQRALFYSKLIEDVDAMLSGAMGRALKDLAVYKWQPVSIEEYIRSPYYLNKADAVYPEVMKELIELNSGKYVEAVLTGGIGSGKTTSALYTIAYQLYILSCIEQPQKLFGLDPSHEILFIFQSMTKQLASGVDYRRFKTMIETSPYFKENFPYDPKIDSRLVFPNRIEVVPVSGAETAAIGQNVIGGIIDELNYMAVIEKSKHSVDAGTYDQAVSVYNSIARRRKSRFMKLGKLPGILCLVSSRRYPGQFTDRKEEEARKDKTIFVYDKCVWDIKPEDYAGKPWFPVFVGDVSRKPRILKPKEEVPEADKKLVRMIPEDYRNDFDTDIINALREIAGVSTLARHPFFVNVEAVTESFGKVQSIFSREDVDFVETTLKIYPQRFWKPELPRFAHIDLAISGDSAGMAIGCCTGFRSMAELGLGQGIEMMPLLRYDGLLEIRPPKNDEILFWKVRKVLQDLRSMGLNIRWVTFDTFQSKDTMQLLKQQGFIYRHPVRGCQQ
jgi:hypothetical protein